jgi:hypothetical protein
MKRIWQLVFVALIVGGCGGSTANVTENEDPNQNPEGVTTNPASAQTCGYREGESTRCESDADCGADESCVAGLGNEIVPEREDGVESMPPYDRESVQYCEARACESGESLPMETAEPEPEPTAEPE